MRHLLDTRTLSREDALQILDVAEDMADTQRREIKKLPTLRGKTVVNLFFEDSTRTRISFEAAAKRLSADVINFSAKGSSVSKGESLQDTAQTLQAMGADAVVIRHGASGAPHTLATSGWISAGVLNAGDGTHEHPTQALLDAFTIRKRTFGDDSRGRDLAGLKVAIVGDILHSRVARSNVWLLHSLGTDASHEDVAVFQRQILIGALGNDGQRLQVLQFFLRLVECGVQGFEFLIASRGQRIDFFCQQGLNLAF